MPYVVLATGSAVMRPMELPLDIVQDDPDARAVSVVDVGAQMMQ